MSWLLNNKEWIFSGIGVSAIGLIAYFLKRRVENNKPIQTITSGDNSYNIQGGNDINITIGDKDVRK